ncbi:MAG: type II secretion system minor pseudopilin GspK [Desulfosarcinaceae bacterium]|nr:type II secretion system minor pseudopilin GspK [Desulfosarcinaceae bacterium]
MAAATYGETTGRRALASQRGVALLMTLTVIVLLMTAGLHLNRQVRKSLEMAATQRDQLLMNEMALSGVHAAMAMLIKDRQDSETDSLQEDWASAEAMAAALAALPFENGTLEVVINDERAKIQINALVNFPDGRQFNPDQHTLWDRFAKRLLDLYTAIETVEMDDTDTATIINSVKDWLDSGEDDAITGLSGAESSYYEDLDPPYACKNGPFTHLDEVSLVKGVTPELFFGFGELMGLSNYLTIYGATETDDNRFRYDGRININTAELPVVAALLEEDVADWAQALIDYRDEQTDGTYAHDVTRQNWHKNVPGFSGITIDENLITIESNFFRVTVTAGIDDVKMTRHAVVHRRNNPDTGRWYCKILNWQAD